MEKKFSDGKPYRVVALCLTRFKEQYQANLVRALCAECKAHGIKLLIFASTSDLYNGGINDIGEAQIFSLLMPEKFDAVLIMSETFKNDDVLNGIVSRCIDKNVPVISIDKIIDRCSNITFNYGNAFEKIVCHVIEKHDARTINFICGVKGNPFSEERLECYKRILKEKGIPCDENRIMYGDFWSDPTRKAMEEFMETGLPMPDAFICANDIMAIECMRFLKEQGYKIPEDVMVTGFDGVDLERYYSPRLTTAEYDIDALVKRIYEDIKENIDGKSNTETKVVDYKFRVGSSCGCKSMVTDNVEERLYEEKFIMDDREEFIQMMYNMIATLSNYPDLHFIFSMIPEYIQRSNIKECWICLNDNVVDENMDICFDFNREDNNYARYTDIMRVPMHSTPGSVGNVKEFEPVNLLPDIENILDNNEYVMFAPIHLQGFTVGYAANTFDDRNFKFSYYQTFLQDFRHILELYVNRATTERLYVTDVLTHIYNRHGFYRNVGEIIRQSRKLEIPFTIISIDMDGLKKINDTYGHAEGDYAIKTIAECMMANTVKSEICARFGGDEFTIAFSDMRGEERAKQIISGIKKSLDGFNSLGEKPYEVSASFGVFSRIAGKDDSLDDFIKRADNLMYADKKEHKKQQQALLDAVE